MKRILRSFALLNVIICVTVARANPIMPGYINELSFPSGSWSLEIHSYEANLDGWTLSSRSGTGAFKPGISLSGNYILVGPSALQSPLTIEPLGDTVGIRTQGGFTIVLRFGNETDAQVPTPKPGQSICLEEEESFYYLDSSPTPGFHNDSAGAMGTIGGIVKDASTGIVLQGVRIWHSVWLFDSTNSAGAFFFPEYARNVHLYFSHAGYDGKAMVVSLVPGADIYVDIDLDPLSEVPRDRAPEGFTISQNYPNPFNPSTTFALHLPSASRVHADLYDAAGRRVADLLHGVFSPGDYTSTWHGIDDFGVHAASGVYVAMFRVTDLLRGTVHTRALKVLLVR